jgi:MFS family permease
MSTQGSAPATPTAYNMRTFYTLIITQVFSIMGSRISALAIGIWVYAETGNATPLTLVAFFTALPMVLASSLSGVLADRWDRRYVMAIADAGQALGTLLLLFSFASDSFELWHLYGVAAFQAIFGVFQGPAFQASTTMLVPDEQRNRANTIMQLAQPAAGIFAPAIAGFVYALVNVEGAIIIDLLTFLVAVAVVLNVHIPAAAETDEGRASRGTVWKEAWSGVQYLMQRRTLLWVTVYIAFVNLLMAGSMSLGTPYILARTDNNETALGIILSLFNLGGLAGGILFSIWGGRGVKRMNLAVGGVIWMGVALMAIGVSRTGLALAVSMPLLLLCAPMINSSFMSMMQAKTPPDMQGRVFAVLGQISMVLTPLAYLISGPLADKVFEPAVGGSNWEPFAPLVGTGPGAGIGLIMVIGGLGVTLMSVFMISRASIRNMEENLPDYLPAVAAPEEGEAPVVGTPEPGLSADAALT